MSEHLLTLLTAYGPNVLVLLGVFGASIGIRAYGRRHEAATRRRGASLID